MSGSEYAPPSGSAFPPVLDACCGGRMFWFDKADSRCLYVDKRREQVQFTDNGKVRFLDIAPDTQADFTDLPIPSDTFDHIVFDPPHCHRNGAGSWIGMKYGTLRGLDWRDMLRKGFAECFRVLRPGGTLVFKWNEEDVPVREILALTPERPLYGHKSGRLNKTHWIAFLKPNAGTEARVLPSPPVTVGRPNGGEE